jgi:hypothetical protein
MVKLPFIKLIYTHAIRVTRRVPLVGHERLILPEQLRSPCFSVAQLFIICVVLYASLFVLFDLAIVLSILAIYNQIKGRMNVTN